MIRTGSAALSWARGVTSWRPSGMCLVFSRSAFGVDARYGSARLGWLNAKKKHRVSSGAEVPAGVPVWWLGGSRGFGHVAVSLGGGLCRSTDWPRKYMVNTARIDDISRRWGLKLVGWSEDINSVTVYKPSPTAAKTSIDASRVREATLNETKVVLGSRLKRAVAAEVGKGSMNLSTAVLGSAFKEQYKLVQKEYFASVGARPSSGDIDGIPGPRSLEWLGKRHGFTVHA